MAAMGNTMVMNAGIKRDTHNMRVARRAAWAVASIVAVGGAVTWYISIGEGAGLVRVVAQESRDVDQSDHSAALAAPGKTQRAMDPFSAQEMSLEQPSLTGGARPGAWGVDSFAQGAPVDGDTEHATQSNPSDGSVVGDGIEDAPMANDGPPPDMQPYEFGYRGRLPDATLIERRLDPAAVDHFVSRLEEVNRKRQQVAELAEGQGLPPQARARSLSAIDEQVRAIRQELGDDTYDRYLGAALLPNRLTIGSPVEGTALETVGLMPGDVFVSYDGAKVFGMSDMRAKPTTKEWVPVVMSRAGKTFETLVPIGPLGIQFSTASTNPDAGP